MRVFVCSTYCKHIPAVRKSCNLKCATPEKGNDAGCTPLREAHQVCDRHAPSAPLAPVKPPKTKSALGLLWFGFTDTNIH